jgi:hypothetical protein
MRQFIPALRTALIVSIVFLAAVIVLGLAFGADKPVQPAYALMFGLIAYGLLSKAAVATPDCSACGTQQPAVRTPNSLRQTFWGGWTCATCGIEIDRRGRAITPKA